MIFLELSYKFNNDEKSVLIERKEFLNPRSVTFYLKDGDSIYVTNNQQVYVNQLYNKRTFLSICLYAHESAKKLFLL